MSTLPTPLRSPKGRFLTGHLTPFARDPLGFLTDCARQCGDLVPLTFLGRKAYLVNHPDYVEQILATGYRDFRKPAVLRQPFMRRLLGNGLVTSERDFWVRQRRLAQPAFHRERVNAYSTEMVR